MICYLDNVNEAEICALNYYWWRLKGEGNNFFSTIDGIDELCKPEGARSIKTLIKKAVYFESIPQLICRECGDKITVSNRREYVGRISGVKENCCEKCFFKARFQFIDSAYGVIRKYKAEVLKPHYYLEELSFIELLALISILNKGVEAGFIASFDDIKITGCDLIDEDLIESLFRKRVLVLITLGRLPPKMKSIKAALCQAESQVRYDSPFKEILKDGIYLRPMVCPSETEGLDVNVIIIEKLESMVLSVDGIKKIHRIILDSQVVKLENLIGFVMRDFNIQVEISIKLKLLLDRLAENYAPQVIYFTFRYIAQAVYSRIKKENPPHYIAKRYFTKFLENYMVEVEKEGYKLDRVSPIPSELECSPFEVLFSKLYLNDYANWNMLSVKDVVAFWLRNVSLEEGVQSSRSK